MLMKPVILLIGAAALSACVVAEADMSDHAGLAPHADRVDRDHENHQRIVHRGDHDFLDLNSLADLGMTREEIERLKAEINEEVLLDLADARRDIQEALEDVKMELEDVKLETSSIESQELREEILAKVEIALVQAQAELARALQQIEKKERQLLRKQRAVKQAPAPQAPRAPARPSDVPTPSADPSSEPMPLAPKTKAALLLPNPMPNEPVNL
jgi:hypothetical protein